MSVLEVSCDVASVGACCLRRPDDAADRDRSGAGTMRTWRSLLTSDHFGRRAQRESSARSLPAGWLSAPCTQPLVWACRARSVPSLVGTARCVGAPGWVTRCSTATCLPHSDTTHWP